VKTAGTTHRNLAAVPSQAEREPTPDLRDAVRDALAEMKWLQPSDAALAALALRIAAEIESAVERAADLAAVRRDAAGDESLYKRLQKLEAQCDATKAVGWLGPQLQACLRDIGGTPVARKAMNPDKPIGGRLAKLRAEAADAARQDDT
jgi:hypothetical protein